MSENPTGYGESPDTTDGSVGAGRVDASPGNDVPDDGGNDTTLTTDDDAQRDDSEARPGNTSD
jgi:hypothetical protein